MSWSNLPYIWLHNLFKRVRRSLFQICIQTSTSSTITFYILKTSEVDVFLILKEKFSFNRCLEILCGHRKTRQCGLFWEFDAKGEVLTSIADYPQINRFDSEVCLDFKLPLVRKLRRTPNRTLNLNKWSSFVNDFFFLRYICTKNKFVFYLIANKKSLLSNTSGKVTEGSAKFSREIVQSHPQGRNAFFCGVLKWFKWFITKTTVGTPFTRRY